MTKSSSLQLGPLRVTSAEEEDWARTLAVRRRGVRRRVVVFILRAWWVL
jgi:hypothetical protein